MIFAEDDEACFGGILRINVGNIVENWRRLRELVAPAECAVVLKSDGYGLGAQRIAVSLWEAGARHFFVALPKEAVALRNCLPEYANIYVLNGLLRDAGNYYIQANLIPVLNSYEQVMEWMALGRQLQRKLKAIVQVDTGMARMGMSGEDMQRLEMLDDLHQHIEVVALISHLACADTPASPVNQEQRDRFIEVARSWGNIPLSLANSPGCFLGKQFHFDLCRVGAALYGLRTSPSSISLVPVVELSARIIQIRSVPKGTAVGYGHIHVVNASRRLATISVGYADGWPRGSQAQVTAWFNGYKLPIVGRISMDTMVIDVSEVPHKDIHAGNFVELLGPNQSPDDIAPLFGTIGYELIARLGPRFHREYIE